MLPPIDIVLPPGDPLPVVEVGEWHSRENINDAVEVSDDSASITADNDAIAEDD